ncbi:hypothetical protein, partial [Exiguobacterium sp. RIT594]|uniref:hypothetical protein n=1 Tax=Exiguobacterium sp. RIT594 TaxID=2282449 RepID=UPI000E1B4AFD
MFNLNKLNEKVEYEKWILAKVSNLISYQKNIRPSVIEFDSKEKTYTHHIQLNDSMSYNSVIDVYKDLSPLLFVNSYKTIDMFVEWILDGNKVSYTSNFVDKAEKFDSLLKKRTVKLPNSIKEKEIYLIISSIYHNLKNYRNKIIHSKWGENKQGNLIFTNTKGLLTDQILTFKSILIL